MSEQQTVKDTLDIIRRALEEDELPSNKRDEDVLILNKLVKDDGTIDVLENRLLKKDEVREILNNKFSELFDKHFEKWLDRKAPNYLDSYLKKK